MSYRGLDHWITKEPEWLDEPPVECAGCGDMKTDCLVDERGWFFCRDCVRRAEDDDPAPDRGDFEYHQRNDR